MKNKGCAIFFGGGRGGGGGGGGGANKVYYGRCANSEFPILFLKKSEC